MWIVAAPKSFRILHQKSQPDSHHTDDGENQNWCVQQRETGTHFGIKSKIELESFVMFELQAPKFKEWGASLVTIHGRSREQRYTRSADWDYIRQVAQAASPLPVLGNGDVLSYEDYKIARETCPELAGIMIGRGALIKPWIFTEIKEQKLWDISSSERFDVLKKYANYGLEHWGSDNKGVENTRRFMLEWLSFLHRYVPVGLLEQPPQKINERPPFYKGRNDLETLMASTSASDWVKISEMLLGPVPENFQFLPKHKANSYK
jgi:tRNA-dihydrouridine synthase 3